MPDPRDPDLGSETLRVRTTPGQSPCLPGPELTLPAPYAAPLGCYRLGTMQRPWPPSSALLVLALGAAGCSVFGPSFDGLTGGGGTAESVSETCPTDDPSCGPGCPADRTSCGDACVDTLRDTQHCGACGRACGPGRECEEGTCVVPCADGLRAAVVDAWGTRWDGVFRAAATVTQAQQACAAFRGRLPTISEIHRTRAGEEGAIATLSDVEPLWTIVPSGEDPAPSHVVARLSDGTPSSSVDTAPVAYRCVCPVPPRSAFVGAQCSGPPGAACIPLQGAPGSSASALRRTNLDARDRPRANKTSAIFECAFAGGHLATPLQLAEAIVERWDVSGVGTELVGSGASLMAADDVDRNASAAVRFETGKPFAFQSGVANGLEAVPTRAELPFRCAGPTIAAVHPAQPAGTWTSPTRRQLDATDQPPATAIEAVQRCFDRGGHLPTSADLAEAIVTGLPAGSMRYLWTSDQTGDDGEQLTLAVHRWADVEVDHSYGVDDRSWSAKTEVRPYRCVFYPVDTAYAGPASCVGPSACTLVALPGASGAKMWFDPVDRLVAADPLAAIQSCLAGGGHLPSQRDYAEAIRAGLPNGSGMALLASDLVRGTQMSIFLGVVSWRGQNPAFDDLRGASGVTAGVPRAHRCMWTNEVR